MWRARYQDDLASAWGRVEVVPSQALETDQGRIRYSRRGSGPPVLMSHGIFGGHTEGLGMVDMFVGPDYDAIAPSRFGYFDSTLPEGATPATQADAYVRLLDHLEIARVTAVGFSAGSTSVIELALRHPDRVDALVLASANLPGSSRAPGALRPFITAALHWQFGFWALKRVMPETFMSLLGIPRGYHPSIQEQRTIDEVANSVLPLKPRTRGAIFDTLVSNPAVNDCPLEKIHVPTLIVHSVDDSLAAYEYAVEAEARIPGCRFVTMRRGGHLFLGHDHLVRREISVFVREILIRQALESA